MLPVAPTNVFVRVQRRFAFESPEVDRLRFGIKRKISRLYIKTSTKYKNIQRIMVLQCNARNAAIQFYA